MAWPPEQNFTFRIGSEDNIELPTIYLTDFLGKFEKLKDVASLVLFELEALPTENHYRYQFRTTDDRWWRQVLIIPPAGEVSMTFDVADEWPLSQFQPHRDVRDSVIELVRQVGISYIRWREEP